MKESRVKKSMNNIIFGCIEQIATLIFAFLTRTIFIKTLNAQLLGINGLFTNILSILSIAELGFGTAIIYSMYKPIAEHNEEEIAAYMNYYKKIYNFLAIIVFVLGIAIIPLLKYLVNADVEIDNIVIYYLIFLMDSVCSYLLANRVAIIRANQNVSVISKINTFFIILKNILQILSLILFKNFLLYLLIQVIATLITNIYGAIVAKRIYPYAFKKAELKKIKKKKLIENIKSVAIYKFAGTIMNQTDNILMSMICGTVNVGYYSNYNLITMSINKFTNIIFNSITASVGNLNAVEDNEKKLNMFYNINFFSNWMFGFCTVALFVLFNPFIKIWIGDEYIFDNLIVFSIVLNFYIIGILNVILIYRDTTGLFKQTKYVFIITAIINLILSIILGKNYGVFGILIASAISRILTNCWFEPYKIFKEYFKKSSKKYFCDMIVNVLFIVLSILILKFIFLNCENYITNENIIFIIKMLVTAIVPNCIFYLGYRNKKEIKYFKEILQMFLNRLKGRKLNYE